MKIMVQGRMYRSISAASRAHGICQSVVYKRMRGLGESPTSKEIDDCFTRAVTIRVPSKAIMVHGIKFDSISAAADYFNLIPATAAKRLRRIGSEPTQEAIDECFKPAIEPLNVQLTINGEIFSSISKACKHHGILKKCLLSYYLN
jgi:transposase-like protein